MKPVSTCTVVFLEKGLLSESWRFLFVDQGVLGNAEVTGIDVLSSGGAGLAVGEETCECENNVCGW